MVSYYIKEIRLAAPVQDRKQSHYFNSAVIVWLQEVIQLVQSSLIALC